MITLKLAITEERLGFIDKPVISSGDQNSVKLEVTCCENWDGYVLSAVFFTDKDNTIYEKLLVDNSCTVPNEVLADEGYLNIGIRGVKESDSTNMILTSTLVRYRILEGAPVGTATEVEPSPTLYEQILLSYQATNENVDNAIHEVKALEARFDAVAATRIKEPEQFTFTEFILPEYTRSIDGEIRFLSNGIYAQVSGYIHCVFETRNDGGNIHVGYGNYVKVLTVPEELSLLEYYGDNFSSDIRPDDYKGWAIRDNNFYINAPLVVTDEIEEGYFYFETDYVPLTYPYAQSTLAFEVADARVDNNGKTYDSLGAIIRQSLKEGSEKDKEIENIKGEINNVNDNLNNVNDNLTSLKGDLTDVANGKRIVKKDIIWKDGYIDKNGVIKKSVLSKYAIIDTYSNEHIKVGTANSNITIIGTTNSDDLNVGDTITVKKTTSNSDVYQEFDYYCLKDEKIVICVLKSNYNLSFFKKNDYGDNVRVENINSFVNGGYYNTGLLNNATNRVRAENFIVLNENDTVHVKNIPSGYDCLIALFDYNTNTVKKDYSWGDVTYPITVSEKTLMLPVFRKKDNSDINPSEIDALISVYGSSFTDITNKDDSVLSLNPKLQEKINQSVFYRNNNIKPLCIAHISDFHNDQKRLSRFCKFLSSVKSVDDAICTGDMTNKYADGMAYWSNVNGAERILTCIGNHDGLFDASGTYDWYTSQSTMAQAYEKVFAPYISNWEANYQSNTTYYYKDYPTEQIRLVVLDSMRSGEDASTQNSWLASVLSDAKNQGYSVVCATHCVPETSSYDYFDCTFTSKTITCDELYDGCVTSKIYQETVENFINNGGKFITWICGHTHVDYIFTTREFPNQMWIVVTCGKVGNNTDLYRDDSTKYQDAFNIIVFDTNIKAIKIIRVGADRDRLMRNMNTVTISYENRTLMQ